MTRTIYANCSSRGSENRISRPPTAMAATANGARMFELEMQ